MNRACLRSSWLLIPILLAAAAETGFSQLTNSLPLASGPLPDTGLSVLRVFGSLALVVGLFLGGVWCFKNWQRLAIGKGKTPRLQILEVKPLGGRHALYLVGYEQQRLLLGSSPAGVSLITHLPESDEVQPDLAPSPSTGSGQAPSGFAQVLQRVASSPP